MAGPERLASLPAAIIAEVDRVLFHRAEKVAVDAQLSISRGAVSGKGHVPSRPGEPPRNDSGVLAGGIEAVRVGPLRVRVQSTAPYSAELEYGTSRMSERPFMRPARDRNRAPVKADLVKAARRAIRRHFGR